jgi:hypothetical protein
LGHVDKQAGIIKDARNCLREILVKDKEGNKYRQEVPSICSASPIHVNGVGGRTEEWKERRK